MNICADMNTQKVVKESESRKLINNDYKMDTLGEDESKLPDENILDEIFYVRSSATQKTV